jgi:hypothetical protein
MTACTEQATPEQSYGFAQSDSGHWKAVGLDALEGYPASSKVRCGPARSEIEVAWHAESGDWAVSDRYSSAGPFFTRVIRFARSDDTIEITRARPGSRSEIRMGPDVKEYAYLLRELSIWTQRSDVPYHLPDCAAGIFKSS